MKTQTPLERLRHHITGAIERGEKEPIVEQTKLSHTPGPWQAVLDRCPTTKNRWLVEKRDAGWKTFICEVHSDVDHPAGEEWQGTREANAKLIAAAPALAQALDSIFRYTMATRIGHKTKAQYEHAIDWLHNEARSALRLAGL